MSQQFEHIHRSDTAISIQEEVTLFQNTFVVGEFCEWLHKFLVDSSSKIDAGEEELEKWTKEGLEARVLFPNQNWKKGKVRISFEFIADETESPLDDIRQGNKTDET